MMRRFSYILFGSLFLLLEACSPKASLTSSSEDSKSDDVYYADKSEKKASKKARVQRSSDGKDRPDYYNPKVAEQMEWERMMKESNPLYRRTHEQNHYDRSYYPYQGAYRHSNWGPSYSGKNKGSYSSGGNSGSNSDSSNGSSDDSGGSNSKSRDRSYDTGGNSRDR